MGMCRTLRFWWKACLQWVCFHYWSLHYGEAVRTHPSIVRADCRGKFGQAALTSSTSVQFVFVCYQLPSALGSGNKRHALINMYFIHSCHFGSREHLCLPLSRVATGSHDSLPPAHPAKLCADRRGRLGTDGRASRTVRKERQRRSTKTHKPQTQHLHNFAGWAGGKES